MKAGEIIKKYVKKGKQEEVGIIAFHSGQAGTWWHIHNNEEIPQGWKFAIHLREEK